MPHLIIFTPSPVSYRDGTTAAFPCTIQDRMLHTRRIGDSVLLVHAKPRSAPVGVGQGKLAGFSPGSGGWLVHIADIRFFGDDIPLGVELPHGPTIGEVADDVFDEVLAQATLLRGMDDAAAIFSHEPITAEHFTEQLRRQNDARCSFSDVRTGNGVAIMVRPLDQGGAWHARNFLFLDPEPGRLFENFAWSVGPRFEIIIDAHAVTSDISDTVNRTGMLALADRPERWPDREALAWHFEQFVQRVRGRD
ncbi:hypothetical protein IC608_17175 [Devosia sp. PTR5]|uniref:Uncharacterized protein n=1 Tax=Devosia oryzisoli TaxID=2774138 RepID=A0A927FVP1_9HYPH|nr:hypothetical protein [Devosia oryzisoli]MBD8067205.1 hypothetical protein [Devosia oryzisoli]